MFGLAMITLYFLSIKLSFDEIGKTSHKVIRKLKNEGFLVEEEKKIKNNFLYLSLIPMFNLFSISLFKDNFDESYYELRRKFIKKEYIIPSPILEYVNKFVMELDKYEVSFVDHFSLDKKISHIEKRKNLNLFSSYPDFISMSLEEQKKFLRDEVENKKIIENVKKKIETELSSEEAVIYLQNMKRIFFEDKEQKKVKIR